MTHRTLIQLYPAHDLDPSEGYRYGIVDTTFGPALVISRAGYLLGLGFTDQLDELRMPSWPKSDWTEDNKMAAAIWRSINNEEPLKAVLLGTEFQQKVWQALLDLEEHEITTYKQLAERIGKPTAYRAVANAVGANPISLLIPCHQVIGSDGSLHGYRWGINKKKALLGRI